MRPSSSAHRQTAQSTTPSRNHRSVSGPERSGRPSRRSARRPTRRDSTAAARLRIAVTRGCDSTSPALSTRRPTCARARRLLDGAAGHPSPIDGDESPGGRARRVTRTAIGGRKRRSTALLEERRRSHRRHDAATAPRIIRREPAHRERIRPMGVEQHRRAARATRRRAPTSRAVSVASVSGDGSARSSSEYWSIARRRRIDLDRDDVDRRRGRMRFEIEQQQRPQHSRIAHRRRQLQHPRACVGAIDEPQLEADRRGAAVRALERQRTAARAAARTRTTAARARRSATRARCVR